MKYVVLFYILFIFSTAFAQSEVRGVIIAATGETLPGASVILKNPEGKIISYAIAGDKGDYTIKAEAGNYSMEASFLGFQRQAFSISIKDNEKLKHDFVLEQSGTELKEVVIDHQPVKLKGDTLVYDARALSTGHEVVVEDLLKNIPGITVLSDGTIKFGDKAIEKVLVDGDDLFNRGYSILTKNMPSKPLDKVEVLQNYSNNKHLKGIENSDAVALNLTVQKEYKNIWFGNLMLAYGIEERYQATGNLMNFGKSFKTYFTFDFNNAGFDRVGNIEDMFYNSGDMETIGEGYRAASVMSIGAGTTRLGDKRTRFNNAEMATLSTILPLGKRAKLTLRGFMGFDELSAFQSSLSVFDFEGTHFENREVNTSVTNLQRGYINAFVNYDVSSTKMLQASATFNAGNSDFRNHLVFNGISTKEKLETRNTYFNQQLTYTYKWLDRNVVLLKARFFTDELPQNYFIDDYLLGDLFTYPNINAVGNDVQSTKQYAGFQADFKLKQKNSDLIEFTVGFDHNDDGLATTFSLFTDEGRVAPADFQSRSSYRVGDLYAEGGYNFVFGDFSLGANLEAHQLFNRFRGKDGSTGQNPFFVTPLINFTWQLNPDNFLTGHYVYNVSNNRLLQVNDAYLLTSSRSFTKGLGYLNQLESHGGGIGYVTKHYLNRFSFGWNINYSKMNDIISYRSLIEQNSALSEAFIMKGGDRIEARFNSHFIVKKLKGTVKLNATAGRTIYYNIVNNSCLRKNMSYNQLYSFGWTSTFKSPFNFVFGTDWSFFQIKSDETFSNTSKYTFLDLMYLISDQFKIKVKTEHYNFGGLDRYNNYFFADAEATYSFSKDKYAIGLDARNLFNTDLFTTYSISDIGYSVNSYRLLPRYILLSFRYRF